MENELERKNDNQEGEENKKKLAELIEENLALTKDLQKMLKRVHRWVIWRRIIGIAKIIFFVFIIFAAFVYLPPFLQGLMDKINQIYGEITNFSP